MEKNELPKYLITNPVFRYFNTIPTQKDYRFYVDIFGELKADRIIVPLKLFKVPKSTDIEDYLALKEFINK